MQNSVLLCETSGRRHVRTVELYAWHFMPYPYLPDDFAEQYESGWIIVPNTLWDRERTKTLYQDYIDDLAYADELSFDGVVVNEHHQNVYGLMPSPNLVAAALAQRTSRCRIAVLGSLLPLHLNPLRVAEEYAMLDNMSGGRLDAGFAMGGGHEFWNYNVPPPVAREQYWEAADLIHRAWTEAGPFEHVGKHYSLRYANPWPRPRQDPHPPIWVAGSISAETQVEVARRGWTYFASTRGHLSGTKAALDRYRAIVEEHGHEYHPHRAGLLLTVYVADSDQQAREESYGAVRYMLDNSFRGHLSRRGRMLISAPGASSVESFERSSFMREYGTKLLGDAESWDEIDAMGSVIVGSPATVRAALNEYAEVCGYLMIQFQMGNLPSDRVRASMELFSREVAPSVREYAAEHYASAFPALATTAGVTR